MRRTLIVGVVAGTAYLIARAFGPKLHERLMARCEAMFEKMPDDFPPKRMLRGIEEIRVNTARTLELLEARKKEAEAEFSAASATEEVRDSA